MPEVKAELHIEVFVDCPHCKTMIDLLDDTETSGYDHNEESYILNQTCPDGHWTDSHETFSVEDVKCYQCGGEFNVKGLNW